MMPHDKKVYSGHNCTSFIIDGDVYTYGEKNLVPRKLIFNEGKISSICHGDYHTILLEKSRKIIYSWGNNHAGVLGLGDHKHWDVPQKIMFDFKSKIMYVACGNDHTMVVTKSNETYGWGYNGYGQLGLGDRKNRKFPHKLPIGNVKSVSCGSFFTIILTEDGCYGCGKNNVGQLGLGNTKDQNSLQKINISNPILISSGKHYTVVLTTDGIYSWGLNGEGQLGLGDNRNRHSPQKINFIDSSSERRTEEMREHSGGSSAIAISCGVDHTMILTKQNELFACGYNSSGQLGVCHSKTRFKFQKINLIEPIWSVHCGNYHTIIMTKSGKYYGCGNNDYGQLGLGDTKSRTVFTEIIFKT